MNFDALVTNAGRLRILVELARGAARDFVELRRGTRLTDGNLSAHAKRLAEGGLIRIDKSFRENKPVTTFLITDAGRRRLEAHVRALTAAVESEVEPAAVEVSAVEDDWVD